MEIALTLPFFCALFSLSLFPLLFPKFWYTFEVKILATWGLLSIGLMISLWGSSVTLDHVLSMILHEYIPFVVFITSICIISGGIYLHVQFSTTPLNNMLFMGCATLSASFLGTTGASLLFLRPFLKIHSSHSQHIYHVIFFVFLVANIGGVLTPLGDPPLFLGFLKGVNFFWPFKNLWLPFILVFGFLILMYGALDYIVSKKNIIKHICFRFSCEGKRNFFLLLLFMGFIAGSSWCPLTSVVEIRGICLKGKDLFRDGMLGGLAIISYLITPRNIYYQHHFSWKPIQEIVRVFLVLFTTMIPINVMLVKGAHGPLESLFSLTSGDHGPFMYFWLTGLLSAFLDNAPTYLAFFNMAGGDAAFLMDEGKNILMAISIGAVFMGAMTYIGNAPNFLIYSVAKENMFPMPSFFGYMIWSMGFLLPILGIMSWVLFF